MHKHTRTRQGAAAVGDGGGFQETLLEVQLQQAAFIERELQREEGRLMAEEETLSRAHHQDLKRQQEWERNALVEKVKVRSWWW